MGKSLPRSELRFCSLCDGVSPHWVVVRFRLGEEQKSLAQHWGPGNQSRNITAMMSPLPTMQKGGRQLSCSGLSKTMVSVLLETPGGRGPHATSGTGDVQRGRPPRLAHKVPGQPGHLSRLLLVIRTRSVTLASLAVRTNTLVSRLVGFA